MRGDFLPDTLAIAENKIQALVAHFGIKPQAIDVVTGRVEEVVSQRASQDEALLALVVGLAPQL